MMQAPREHQDQAYLSVCKQITTIKKSYNNSIKLGISPLETNRRVQTTLIQFDKILHKSVKQFPTRPLGRILASQMPV